MRMAQAFAEIGHSVTLIVPPTADGIDAYGYYGVKPIFTIERLRRLRLRELGLFIWGYRAALASKRLEPDLIYGRQIHGCFFAALLGCPVILEIHEPPRTMLSRQLLTRLVWRPEFIRLVTNSGELAKLLKSEFDLPFDKILAAPNGAEDPGKVIRTESHNGSRLQVGYVGHLYRGRGVDLILKIAKACPWADFHLVGGREEDVGFWRSRAGNLENVFLHGYVTPGTAEQYRQACDVLLAPYQRETLTRRMRDQAGYMSPLKLFEYMASGRAILCADLPVLHEIVRNGQTALMCDPDGPEEWIEALQRLRKDPDMRGRLANAARTVFLRDFTRTARASKILEGIPVPHRDSV
jgi:glycosyltransferase involved in cell wall biosynthesis